MRGEKGKVVVGSIILGLGRGVGVAGNVSNCMARRAEGVGWDWVLASCLGFMHGWQEGSNIQKLGGNICKEGKGGEGS